MDKIKIEALKEIQELRDMNSSPDFETLKKKGFHPSLLRAMIKEGLIRYGGVFSLTEKGEEVLKNYLITESLQKQTKTKLKIIFDTNIFDEILNGSLNINDLIQFKEKAEFYITHIQVDEINKCSDKERRAKLFLLMGKLQPIIIPTSSFILGKSRLGEARLGNGIIFKDLQQGNMKHASDALIGETSIREGLILVTNDKTLRKRVNSRGGKAISVDEFRRMIK